jgi:hydrogenase expression/formation protein HypE
MASKDEKITMLHGAGGTVMHDLVKNYLVKAFGGIANAEIPLEAMDDAQFVGDIVFKSDSHAVKPYFLRAATSARIAISGTVKTTSVASVLSHSP